MNKELLDNWLEHGLIELNITKELFKWTRKAKKLVPVPVRVILASISNGKKLPQHNEFKLAVHHFDKKGFYRGKTKGSSFTKM